MRTRHRLMVLLAAGFLALLSPVRPPQEAGPEPLRGTIVFRDAPSFETLDHLQDLGARFLDFGDGPVGSRTLYPARVPASRLANIEVQESIARFEITETPPQSFTLHRAASEVQADAVWALTDLEGLGLTGRGVTVCDIDGVADIFHPMFFRADGGTFAWLDRDGDGVWSPGDAVDLDGDGLPGPDETLGWLRADGLPDANRDTTQFIAGYDFLFQDANGNGARDFGPPEFTEQDPCYGERFFVADDVNGDGGLDPGEFLVGLKTCKVRAVYDHDIYRRGEDLIRYRSGGSGEHHGTRVCGILAGGWPGMHRLTGISPDVDILIAGARSTESMLWARNEGADIILFEFAGSVSDGSSSFESVVDELSEEGMIFVVGAGNERHVLQHVTFNGGESRQFDCHDWWVQLNFAWRGASPPTLRVIDPKGGQSDFPIENSRPGIGEWEFDLDLEESLRGTRFLNLYFRPLGGDSVASSWSFSFPEWDGVVHGYYNADDEESPTRWIGFDGKYTVTWPATADSAITVAAYDNDDFGAMAWFSGEGPRLDGYPVLDIAAPGVRVMTAGSDGPLFDQITGTSAAGPFVAGAAALLKQAFPDMDSGLFRSLLYAGAGRDSQTMDPDRWGAGRLRIHNSLAAGLAYDARTGRTSRLAVLVSPNPSPGPTRIFWEGIGGTTAEIRVFTVDGRLVWETTATPSGGRRSWVDWDGRNRLGSSVPQGVYFAHVREGDQVGTARLIRIN